MFAVKKLEIDETGFLGNLNIVKFEILPKKIMIFGTKVAVTQNCEFWDIK